jgi:hypothetical protein
MSASESSGSGDARVKFTKSGKKNCRTATEIIDGLFLGALQCPMVGCFVAGATRERKGEGGRDRTTLK